MTIMDVAAKITEVIRVKYGAPERGGRLQQRPETGS